MNALEALERQGITNIARAHWDASTPALYEEAVRRREGMIAHLGPLVVRTGEVATAGPAPPLTPS